MGPCFTCGRTIAFGAVKDRGYKFCSQPCRQRKAPYLDALQSIPDADVDAEAENIRNMSCPDCGKKGGIDIHKSMFVWSAILFTRFQESRSISCTACGRKKQAMATLGTAAFGWWGVPFGLVGAPTGILVNVARMVSGAKRKQPSKELRDYARDRLFRASRSNQGR